jgi:RNA polymerase sigma factor (sigma-70 family)
MTPKSLFAPARLAGRSLLGTQTDERLVDLVRAGNETAFEVIVNRYRRGLVRYVARMLPDGRAEDVVQQTFVNALRAMQTDDTELRLRPWLYRIAHNLAINALRDRSRMVEELHDDIDGVETPDHALERRQGLREVLAAVKSLPDRQRSALVLREMEGRSYEEIATELGASGGAVRQLLSRARDGVRAGATALTPPAFLGRIPWAAHTEPLAARVAEACGTGAAGAAAAKLCAGALVTGAVVTGVAAVPNAPPRPEREVSARPGVVAPGTDSRAAAGGQDGLARSVSHYLGSYRGGSDDRSGPGSGGNRSGDEDHSSGPGSGRDTRDNSGSDSSGSAGSGSGHSGSGSGSSGSGSSGSGHSGSGSGSSGSGSSGSGHSGSGSGSSGSGSSGSGSSSSGSGGSGSGRSGSGSSSSGSGSSGSGSGSSGSGSGSSGSGSGSSGSSGSGSGSSGSGPGGSAPGSSGSGSSGSGPGSAETFSAPSDSSGSGSSGSGSEGDELESGGGVSGSSG